MKGIKYDAVITENIVFWAEISHKILSIVNNGVKDKLGINFKTLEIKRSWKLPKEKEEMLHVGLALNIALDFEKTGN